MSEKTRMVEALGERRLLLPTLLNEALAANDRAKCTRTRLARIDGLAKESLTTVFLDCR